MAYGITVFSTRIFQICYLYDVIIGSYGKVRSAVAWSFVPQPLSSRLAEPKLQNVPAIFVIFVI